MTPALAEFIRAYLAPAKVATPPRKVYPVAWKPAYTGQEPPQ